METWLILFGIIIVMLVGAFVFVANEIVKAYIEFCDILIGVDREEDHAAK